MKIKNIKHNKIKFDLRYGMELVGLVKGSLLAGGSLRRLYEVEPIFDFDIFFLEHSAIKEMMNLLEERKFVNTYTCPLGHLYTYVLDGIKVQLITEKIYKSVEDCIKTFDFHACAAAYYDNTFYISKEFIKDVKKGILTIQNLEFPVATFKRIIKYQEKGYDVSDAIEDFCRILSSTGFEIVDGTFRRYLD